MKVLFAGFFTFSLAFLLLSSSSDGFLFGPAKAALKTYSQTKQIHANIHRDDIPTTPHRTTSHLHHPPFSNPLSPPTPFEMTAERERRVKELTESVDATHVEHDNPELKESGTGRPPKLSVLKEPETGVDHLVFPFYYESGSQDRDESQNVQNSLAEIQAFVIEGSASIMNNYYFATFRVFAQLTYITLMVKPFAYLYLYAPFVHGYGMWGGKPFEEICCILLSPPATVWSEGKGREVCVKTIQQHFQSYIVTLGVLIYFIIGIRVIKVAYNVLARLCNQSTQQIFTTGLFQVNKMNNSKDVHCNHADCK